MAFQAIGPTNAEATTAANTAGRRSRFTAITATAATTVVRAAP
jgi:hypothetical protein